MSIRKLIFIKRFEELTRYDVAQAGGKGASLGEMTRAGIPVPPGFVILSSAFEEFLEETDLNVEIDAILDSVNHKEIHTVEAASEKIKALILQAKMPQDIAHEIQKSFKNLNSKYVAVRSSATAEDSASAAWAGQLESYLNTTEETLLENVKKCWASLFTPRAIFYRFEKGYHLVSSPLRSARGGRMRGESPPLRREREVVLDRSRNKKYKAPHGIAVAVVIQKMVQSEVSGVAFSVHPVTQDHNQLIIEAGFGLGEAIVAGQITPDSYVVKKPEAIVPPLKFRILDKNIATQPKALVKSKTGENVWQELTGEHGSRQALSDQQILELSKLVIKIENHYGFPCDVEWAFEKGGLYIVQSRPITTLPLAVKKISEKENWFVVVSFKTELLTEAVIHKGYRESLPKLSPQVPNFRNRMIIDNDIYIDLTETTKIQEYFSTDTINKASKVYGTIERQSRKLLKTAQDISSKILGLSNNQLADKLNKFFQEYQNAIGAIGIPTLIDLTLEARLKDILQKNNFRNIYEALSALAIPHKPIETFKEKEDLLLLANKIHKKQVALNSNEVRKLIRQHFNKYGWLHSTLFLGEMYDEFHIEKAAKVFIRKATKELAKLEKDRERQLVKANEIIKKIRLKNDKELARFFQKAVYYRTARLEWLNKGCFMVRPLLNETARRLNISYDYLIYLMPEEITLSIKRGKLGENVLKKIRDRKRGYAYISDNENEYLLITGNNLTELKRRFSKGHKKEETLSGTVASKGIAKGKVVVVRDRDELYKVKEGDILVTKLTTPDFVVAMKKAAGIITDLGGLTSHAAVVSRELKIPCIVGTKHATKILSDGMIIELNANRGTISIL